MSDTDKGLGAWIKSWFADPVQDPATGEGTVNTLLLGKFKRLQAFKDSDLPYDEEEYLRLKELLGKAGGGMINIDEMTRPLGYKEGKEVGVRERIYNWLAPNEKMSDEELRLQNINPDSVLPEERPQAEGRPEGVLQGIFGELFGGRGAEGSTLVDFLKSKRARLMSDIQGEMQGNIFGTGVDEGKIKILQIEIDKLTEQLNDLGEK